MMSCYILKQTSTKVNLLNSPNKNPKISSLVTIVAPLIFDQRLKKQNLQSKTNKQTKTQGLLVTSWSCFPPYLLPRPLPPPRGGSSCWKGGAQIVNQWRGFQGAGPLAGVQGAEPPGGGCKGVEPPCVGKFWISELNSRDLVHTFCQHHIENLLIYFQ